MTAGKRSKSEGSAPRKTARRTKKVASAIEPAAEATATAEVPTPEVMTAPVTTLPKVTPEERHRMIAEAAYYLALKKGPHSDPHENWLQAEAEIDARLRAEGRL